MDKNDLMRMLVDEYGFSFSLAEEIIQQDNAYEILKYIKIAYAKGKQDDVSIYQYSGGY